MTDPRESAPADAAPAIYGHRFPERDREHARWRREVWRVLVEDFFSRWIPPSATVLDFGCGGGEFINAVRAARRIGVDLRDAVRAELDGGVEFLLARDTRVPELPDACVDVVFCSNLLEHLPERRAVTALLREFHRLLRPSGRLLILGPNRRYTGPAYWDFFDHVLPLTHVSLLEALATADLEAEELLPRFLPYTTVGATRVPPALVRWYLRLPFAWRVFGAQFFAVARRRGDVGRDQEKRSAAAS